MTQSQLSNKLVGQKSAEGSWLWLIKIVTGLFIIILLTIHFIVNHFIGETGLLTYADVIAYFQNPIVPIMEICFLIVVVSHSLIGMRSIILDMKPSRALLKFIDFILWIVGAGSIIYGIWLAIAIATAGA